MAAKIKHDLVPEHRVLSKEEADILLEKLSIKPTQLPKILISDPVVLLLDAKINDIIEITRDSYIGGKSIYFRLVIGE